MDDSIYDTYNLAAFNYHAIRIPESEEAVDINEILADTSKIICQLLVKKFVINLLFETVLLQLLLYSLEYLSFQLNHRLLDL